MIHFGMDVTGNLDAGLSKEWLETNGIGGFASSTLAGANTRRYHGLLTAALHPPVDRYVLLSKVEETVFLNGERYDLSVNLYPGAVYPSGYTFLKRFRLDPFPVFTYEIGGLTLEKSVFMVHGENTTVLLYELLGAGTCTLEVRPLIAFRDYHSVTRANEGLNPEVFLEEGMASVQPYQGLPRLFLANNAFHVSQDSAWYYNFDYPRERDRGLECREDLFQPMVMQFTLAAGSNAVLMASTERRNVSDAAESRRQETGRRADIRRAAPGDNPLLRTLMAGTDTFIATRGVPGSASTLHTVIAGYPWFSDWGRDTMIALPGLTLTSQRFQVARDILLAFAEAFDKGMCPNRFPDYGETPEYNTVDASLWFFEAVRKFTEYTGDYEFIRERLYATLKSSIEWHLRGTRYGIHCDSDGLISAGGPETQLTWMDARTGDYVPTPRYGKPVEIQALWYNALRFTAVLAERFEDAEQSATLTGLAERAATGFNNIFWNEQAGCLYDVVGNGPASDSGPFRDASIRPNQLIALSLGYTMVSAERARAVLEVVERELLTAVGLRTLSPADPQYIGRYQGGPSERDSAYHQGTVWPWLLGPFVTAYVRSHGDTRRALAGEFLKGFSTHLEEDGLGSISEIFDGDAPHHARGCTAQAWSVAEILRALLEDVEGIRPNGIQPRGTGLARPAARLG